MTTFAILLLMPFALLLTNAVWETIATHLGGGSKVNFGNINCDGTCTFQSMQRKKNPNEVRKLKAMTPESESKEEKPTSEDTENTAKGFRVLNGNRMFAAGYSPWKPDMTTESESKEEKPMGFRFVI